MSHLRPVLDALGADAKNIDLSETPSWTCKDHGRWYSEVKDCGGWACALLGCDCGSYEGFCELLVRRIEPNRTERRIGNSFRAAARGSSGGDVALAFVNGREPERLHVEQDTGMCFLGA